MNSATKKSEEVPKKKLLVSKKAYKGKAPRGAGKVKMVDKVMKHEKRAMLRKEKKKKGGKTKKRKGGGHPKGNQ